MMIITMMMMMMMMMMMTMMVGTHNMNDHSSRSHTILTVHIHSEEKASSEDNNVSCKLLKTIIANDFLYHKTGK